MYDQLALSILVIGSVGLLVIDVLVRVCQRMSKNLDDYLPKE